jgi:hypothetical protein
MVLAKYVNLQNHMRFSFLKYDVNTQIIMVSEGTNEKLHAFASTVFVRSASLRNEKETELVSTMKIAPCFAKSRIVREICKKALSNPIDTTEVTTIIGKLFRMNRLSDTSLGELNISGI